EGVSLAESGHRYLPRRALIDTYGAGGFRFADMSHRGSLLALPSGMHAWPVSDPRELTEESLRLVFDEHGEIDLLLIGTGPQAVPLAAPLAWRLKDLRIVAEPMP